MILLNLPSALLFKPKLYIDTRVEKDFVNMTAFGIYIPKPSASSIIFRTDDLYRGIHGAALLVCLAGSLWSM